LYKGAHMVLVNHGILCDIKPQASVVNSFEVLCGIAEVFSSYLGVSGTSPSWLVRRFIISRGGRVKVWKLSLALCFWDVTLYGLESARERITVLNNR